MDKYANAVQARKNYQRVCGLLRLTAAFPLKYDHELGYMCKTLHFLLAGFGVAFAFSLAGILGYLVVSRLQ